jgi:chromate transport protein ChrA
MNHYLVPVAMIIVGIISLALLKLKENDKKNIYFLVPSLICFFSFLFIVEYSPSFFERNIVVILVLIYWLAKKVNEKFKEKGKQNLLMDKLLTSLTLEKILFIIIAFLNFYYAYKWFNNSIS